MHKVDPYIAQEHAHKWLGTYQFMDRLFKYRWLNHSLFWLFILIITAYYGSLYGGSFMKNLISLAFLIPVQAMATYLLVYYQIPKWFYQKKWLRFIFSWLTVSFIFAIIGRLIIIYIAEPFTDGETDQESILQIISDPFFLFSVYVPSIYLPAVIFLLIKLTKERFAEKQRYETLLAEKRNAELSFLKAQMNPHFLFNTLNNIYSMSRLGLPEAPDAILQLSEILDYTLYDCADERVPVQKEWELIENYCNLEALRYGDRLKVTLGKDIDEPDILIAPLILIALVENAFKHVATSAQNRSYININLEVKDQKLDFQVKNSRDTNSDLPHTKKSGGIGVNNVKAQLELVYPDSHFIHIDESATQYTTQITVEL